MFSRQEFAPQVMPSPEPQPRRSLAVRAVANALIGAALTSGVAGYVETRHRDQELAMQQVIDAQAVRLGQLQERLDRATDIAEGGLDLTEAQVLGEGLGEVPAPPAGGESVGVERRSELRAAVVKLWIQRPGSETWEANCSGTMISSGGETYVATARHCFSPQGIKGGPEDTLPPGATNITDVDPNSYIVATAGLHSATPLGSGRVEAISTKTDADWALLKVNFDGASITPSYAIPDSEFISQEPVPGMGAVVFSMPGAAGGDVLTGEGTYLGAIQREGEYGQYDYVVGLKNADTPDHDACNFGASGSSAMLANGRLLGPLSFRNNIYYEPGSPPNLPDDRTVAVHNRAYYESVLGMNLGEFNTLCGYTVTDSTTIPELIAGFDYDMAAGLRTGPR